ncbi:NADH dehydrogenase ubiquinone Fe-S protein 4 [Azospirillum rugosum]|uniref:ETC complex I subunit conserved region n=1 Tax=Azospirillum rugosum TaxID=416170 RepID=A0ABS4SY75_9PROT|nr:NADH dehydrogenase ubiquinone Fe-S protein 4 [Azospirillum rugosum]MBP2297053.1 hypothetical protein [Azospirillum rugosum]MDQ0530847.1 hypothetical protein [Azospirillum rugosum]
MWRSDETINTANHSFDHVTWTFGPQRGIALQPQAANDGTPAVRSSDLRAGATAIIRQAGRSTTTAGRAGACNWVLSFQPCSAQFIEPLMGWCGGDDPLRHVELRFPSREAAVGYAERHGIAYEVSDPPPERGAAFRCPEDASGLWRQWLLECLGSFETGGQWWGNAGPDDQLVAALDRWDMVARASEGAEGADSGGTQSSRKPANAHNCAHEIDAA